MEEGFDAHVFTVDEVATYLRTEPASVLGTLESGRLSGFKIGAEWRILGVAILRFLKEAMEQEQQEAFLRTLTDPISWAHELEKTPAFRAEIKSGDYAPNTVGAWLQEALKGLDARKQGKIVDIKKRDL
jgi:hypothetical protein